MNTPGHKSILLTTPHGVQSQLHHEHSKDEQQGIPLRNTENQSNGGVQFDSEQLKRGRSRTKMRNGSSGTGNLSLSRSRSGSRASSRIRQEEFLKWTVLRRDPSMRLKLTNTKVKMDKAKSGRHETDMSDSDGESDASDDDLDTEEEEDDSAYQDDVSDEEQVTDADNDVEIDEEFHYDLGMKVLPNFVVSLNYVLDSNKQWVQKYEESIKGHENDGVQKATLLGGYTRAMQKLTKGKGSTNDRSYILCADLTTESQYALTYVMGSVVCNGDTLYIIHWDNQTHYDIDSNLLDSVARIRKHVMHMFDCVSAVIDDLDVIILSLQHPYPKHLLNEMIYGLKPVALCCSLSMILSTLQNFVCSVPTLIIRKKLRRIKKKGINE